MRRHPRKGHREVCRGDHENVGSFRPAVVGLGHLATCDVFRATPRRDTTVQHLVNQPDRTGLQTVIEPAHRILGRYDRNRMPTVESPIRRICCARIAKYQCVSPQQREPDQCHNSESRTSATTARAGPGRVAGHQIRRRHVRWRHRSRRPAATRARQSTEHRTPPTRRSSGSPAPALPAPWSRPRRSLCRPAPPERSSQILRFPSISLPSRSSRATAAPRLLRCWTVPSLESSRHRRGRHGPGHGPQGPGFHSGRSDHPRRDQRVAPKSPGRHVERDCRTGRRLVRWMCHRRLEDHVLKLHPDRSRNGDRERSLPTPKRVAYFQEPRLACRGLGHVSGWGGPR
jgi:hypothetical protein